MTSDEVEEMREHPRGSGHSAREGDISAETRKGVQEERLVVHSWLAGGADEPEEICNVEECCDVSQTDGTRVKSGQVKSSRWLGQESRLASWINMNSLAVFLATYLHMSERA